MSDASDRIEQIREQYELSSLSEDELAPSWLEQFERWLESALSAGMPEPNAMVLATADGDGSPSARSVLLRGYDERGLRFNTNYRSRKGRELEANPRATLVFPWYAQQRQVLVCGTVAQLDPAESDEYFAKRPRASRIADLEASYAADEDVPRPPHWGGYLVAPTTVEFWQGRRNRLHDRLRYRRTDSGAWVVERLAP